jgi:hypothetical protein
MECGEAIAVFVLSRSDLFVVLGLNLLNRLSPVLLLLGGKTTDLSFFHPEELAPPKTHKPDPLARGDQNRVNSAIALLHAGMHSGIGENSGQGGTPHWHMTGFPTVK